MEVESVPVVVNDSVNPLVNTSVTPYNNTVTYNRPVSALEDPANYNIRHPLQSKWTLWYRASTKPNSAAVKNAAKSDNWEASLQCVNTIDTVEDFWGMYNNVPGIDKMEDSSDYMFFKEGIRPAWEDPANANGGSHTLQFKGSIPGIGEFVWLNTVTLNRFLSSLIFLIIYAPTISLLAHDGRRKHFNPLR